MEAARLAALRNAERRAEALFGAIEARGLIVPAARNAWSSRISTPSPSANSA